MILEKVKVSDFDRFYFTEKSVLVFLLALGTCSHVCELQRTEVGPFNLLYDCLSEQEWNLENVLRLVSRCKLKFDRYYKIRKKELDEWIPQVE